MNEPPKRTRPEPDGQARREALQLATLLRDRPAGFDFDSYPATIWRAAVNMLLAGGEVETARWTVEILAKRKPAERSVQTLARVLDNVPARMAVSRFSDDPQTEVQVAQYPGANTVLFVFSDYQHHLGLPFALVHRWFGLAPAHVVYLRDFSKAWFLSGIGTLALTRDATIERLRALSASLGAERIVCFSNSSGGFAAVAYGLALGAKRIVCMAGAFDVTAINTPRAKRMLAAAKGYDLRRAFLASARPPELRIVLGESNWDDRLHADYLADLPEVTVLPVEGFAGHTVGIEMMARGRFSEMVDWLMAPSAAEQLSK